MKLFPKILTILMTLAVSAAAQTQTYDPNTNTTPNPVMPKTRSDQVSWGRNDNLGDMQRYQRVLIFKKMTETVYRKPDRDEVKDLVADETLRAPYADFLKLPKTGMIRLLKDMGCEDGKTGVAATDQCLKYPFPGNGSAYSFRQKSHWIRSLADIALADDVFSIAGSLAVGMFVDVGDVALDRVSNTTPGADFIFDFKPSRDVDEANAQNDELKKGIVKGNFRYLKQIRAAENRTFLMRYVAYRGVVRKTFNGFLYNELDFDKRRDLVVAFRVVKKEADGSVWLLWRELRSDDAPRLKQTD
ncbi:MAG: hypothetical protein JSS81_13435 [Acidobacteria bacterium]|nr:hypothetical protein [Acidobacteriota bacterium]